jgi:hypothetical protein
MRRSRFVLPSLAVMVLAGSLLAGPVLAGGRPFTTTLLGTLEVPAGDQDAVGSATVWINPGQGTVCYSWSVSNTTVPVFAAHIHKAPAGVAGGIVVPLPPTGPSSGQGCTTGVDRSLAIAIIQRPWEYYINVHNADFPAGAARGQLSRTP